jgi:hypothetical protein
MRYSDSASTADSGLLPVYEERRRSGAICSKGLLYRFGTVSVASVLSVTTVTGDVGHVLLLPSTVLLLLPIVEALLSTAMRLAALRASSCQSVLSSVVRHSVAVVNMPQMMPIHRPRSLKCTGKVRV